MRATWKVQVVSTGDCKPRPRAEQREAQQALRAIGKTLQAIDSNLDRSAEILHRMEVKLGEAAR